MVRQGRSKSRARKGMARHVKAISRTGQGTCTGTELALGQYIIGDITPSFYDLQKTVYEGTYFSAVLGHGMDPPPPNCKPGLTIV